MSYVVHILTFFVFTDLKNFDLGLIWAKSMEKDKMDNIDRNNGSYLFKLQYTVLIHSIFDY